jgi:ribonuclease HI
MNSIKIYTDGSYKSQNSGISFLIKDNCESLNTFLGYSNLKLKNSTESELFAIILALKYLYSLDLNLKDYNIEIATDEESIVTIFNNKRYEFWNESGYKNSKGRRFRKNIGDWDTLITLVKQLNNKVDFIKVSNEDENNKIVHKYANYARNLEVTNRDYLYILEKDKIMDVFINKEIVHNEDDLKIERIINKKSLWTNRHDKDKKFKWYNEKNDEVVLIDTNRIHLIEEVHLNCHKLDLGRIFMEVFTSKQISIPLVVRKIDDNKYTLIVGITRLIAARIFDIQKVPCIITDLTHEKFIESRLNCK